MRTYLFITSASLCLLRVFTSHTYVIRMYVYVCVYMYVYACVCVCVCASISCHVLGSGAGWEGGICIYVYVRERESVCVYNIIYYIYMDTDTDIDMTYARTHPPTHGDTHTNTCMHIGATRQQRPGGGWGPIIRRTRHDRACQRRGRTPGVCVCVCVCACACEPPVCVSTCVCVWGGAWVCMDLVRSDADVCAGRADGDQGQGGGPEEQQVCVWGGV